MELKQVLSRDDQKLIALNVCLAVAMAGEALGNKVEKWREHAIASRTHESAEYDDTIKALNPRVALVRALTNVKGKPTNA